MSITSLRWADVLIVIVNTHLLANFAGDWERHGMYARVEEKQLRQLAETVQSQPRDSILFVLGDFNIPRGSPQYKDFIVHSGLTDLLAGDTRPTLRVPIPLSSKFPLAIDYAFVRMPEKYSFRIDCDLCFSKKYAINNRKQAYLSDHLGIEIRMKSPNG